jgi:hypothetical protein
MARPRTNRKTTRLTVSLDDQAHATLAALAVRQDVSLAWMVRRAINEFIERNGRLTQPEPPLRHPGSDVGVANLSRGVQG